jgi:surface protein
MGLFIAVTMLLSAIIVGVPPVGVSSAATVDRVASNDRYATSVEVARRVGGGSLSGLDRLILVTGESFPDGLVASGLAGYLDEGGRAGRTAILLTQTASLPAVVAEAITQSGVGVSNVVVVGGPSAVSDTAYAAIARAAGWNGAGENPVARIYGQTRYETAAAVADYVDEVSGGNLDESYRTVLVANGENFPDALAGGVVAYRNGHLIVLSPPARTPSATRLAIDRIEANCAVLLGGPAALSERVGAEVNERLALGGCGVDRVGGGDRFETAALIALRFQSAIDRASQVLLASGVEFADALTAAPLAGGNRPMLLTRSGELPDATAAWLRTNGSNLVVIAVIGGTGVIPNGVVNQAVTAATSTPITPTPSTPTTTSPPATTPPAPPSGEPMILQFSLPGGGLIVLPLTSGQIDVAIDWGTGGSDGCPTTWTNANIDADPAGPSCMFPPGAATVEIRKGSGEGPWLTQYGPGVGSALKSVVSFGDLGSVSMERAFFNETGLESLPTVLPSSVRNVSQMLRGASTFNQDISGWNMSEVTNTSQMFLNASEFNNGCAPGVGACPLDWDTGKVTNMSSMFRNTPFNQNIATWNTGMVTNMSEMFRGAAEFNQNIAAWNTGMVTNMSEMFKGASEFNQNIAAWNTGMVTNMSEMFRGAAEFNQNLSGWVVTSVTTCSRFADDADAWVLFTPSFTNCTP